MTTIFRSFKVYVSMYMYIHIYAYFPKHIDITCISRMSNIPSSYRNWILIPV